MGGQLPGSGAPRSLSTVPGPRAPPRYGKPTSEPPEPGGTNAGSAHYLLTNEKKREKRKHFCVENEPCLL